MKLKITPKTQIDVQETGLQFNVPIQYLTQQVQQGRYRIHSLCRRNSHAQCYLFTYKKQGLVYERDVTLQKQLENKVRQRSGHTLFVEMLLSFQLKMQAFVLLAFIKKHINATSIVMAISKPLRMPQEVPTQCFLTKHIIVQDARFHF